MNQNTHYSENAECPNCKKTFERQILSSVTFCDDCQFDYAFKKIEL